MSIKVIVSYDGTSQRGRRHHPRPGVRPGRRRGRARVRAAHARARQRPRDPRPGRGRAAARPRRRSCSAASAARHVVTDRSTPEGLRALAEREGADVIVFCSDSHTAKGHVAIGNSAERLLEGGPTAVAIAPGRPRRAARRTRHRADRRDRRRRRRRARDGRVARPRARRERLRPVVNAETRPARDRLAPRGRDGADLDQLIRLPPDRDRHLPGARAASRWRARIPGSGSWSRPDRSSHDARPDRRPSGPAGGGPWGRCDSGRVGGRGRARGRSMTGSRRNPQDCAPAEAQRRGPAPGRARRWRAIAPSRSSAPPSRCASGPVHRRASRRRSIERWRLARIAAARYRGGRAGRRQDNRSPSSATRACGSPCRCPRPRSRAASQRKAAAARARAEAPRLPAREGAGAAGDPANRTRGDARGSRPRHALQLVLRGDRVRRHRPRGRPRARPRRSSAPGSGAGVLDRDRRAPDGRARRVPGPRGAAPRAGGGGGADPAGDRGDARAPGAAADRRASRRAGRLRRDRLRGLEARRRRRGGRRAPPGAVRGGRGPRPARGARQRQPDPRLRGGAARRRRRGDRAPSS